MEFTPSFTVDQAFDITGRGCVLAPGFGPGPGLEQVKVGAAIRLVKPDGQVLDTTIHGIEMLKRRRPPQEPTYPILLPKIFTKNDVPPGTRVVILSSGHK